MNKFAKALLLALVFAAPVAISAPSVQAATTTTHARSAKPSAEKTIAQRRTRRTRRRRTRRAMHTALVPHTARHSTVATVPVQK